MYRLFVCFVYINGTQWKGIHYCCRCVLSGVVCWCFLSYWFISLSSTLATIREERGERIGRSSIIVIFEVCLCFRVMFVICSRVCFVVLQINLLVFVRKRGMREEENDLSGILYGLLLHLLHFDRSLGCVCIFSLCEFCNFCRCWHRISLLPPS